MGVKKTQKLQPVFEDHLKAKQISQENCLRLYRLRTAIESQ
jgi:hypothetical protein